DRSSIICVLASEKRRLRNAVVIRFRETHSNNSADPAYATDNRNHSPAEAFNVERRRCGYFGQFSAPSSATVCNCGPYYMAFQLACFGLALLGLCRSELSFQCLYRNSSILNAGFQA